MTNLLKSFYHQLGQAYITIRNKKEFLNQAWKNANERPIEYRFVFDQLSKLAPRSVLDVGTGTTALPALISACGIQVTAIDNIKDYWLEGMFNQHYYVINDDICNPQMTQHFDLITCISVIEHIPDHEKAIKSMVALLRDGGHLILTFPFNREKYVDNVYKLPGASYGKESPYVCQIFSENEIDAWKDQFRLQVAEQEFWQVFSGDLWTFGGRLVVPCRVTLQQSPHLTCIALKKEEISTENQ